MKFGAQITAWFVALLLLTAIGTGTAVHVILRAHLIDDGKATVAEAERRFARQLNELGRVQAEGVRLLTLDYALRRSIADEDVATVLSALRNHGRRIGATRMVLIGTDSKVRGDTGADQAAGRLFAFPELLDKAAEDARAASVVVIDGTPNWMVVVPVFAPDPIAYVAAVLPLDNARLERLRELAGLPRQVGLAVQGPQGWQLAAGNLESALRKNTALANGAATLIDDDGAETIVFARVLPTPLESDQVMAVIGYPLSNAIAREERILLGILPGVGIGLFGAIVALVFAARRVSRPIEDLARQADRVAAGDYDLPPPSPRRDEFGTLGKAMHDMAAAISEREERIRYNATHDPITDLPNRRSLIAAIEDNAKGPAAMLAVIAPRWRETTNTVGRDIGERAMRAWADRIKSRAPSDAVVAAIGEASFGLFLPEASESQALSVGRNLIAALSVPYDEEGLAIDAGVAIGVALRPEHGRDPGFLLRRAEIAILTAQRQDQQIAVYRADADPHRPERLSLMGELRVGLARGEFDLALQPKLDLRENRVTAAEALVRWRHPSYGAIAPENFIPLAEETGNIQHLTRWALRGGISLLSRLMASGANLTLSVNVSVRDLADPELPGRVAGLLREFAVPAHALVLEVTESAAMSDPEAVQAVAGELSRIGIALSIDDFGVGQSSLAYLHRLPIREVKIDKTFIKNMHVNPDDRTIVKSVVELSHGLGYRVTAEGVEDADCLASLRELGCDYAQGYFIARPMTEKAFVAYLASHSAP